MIGRVLVARHHLDVEDEPHIGQHVAVIDVARAARLLRIIAELSSLLVSVERLDRRVGIEHPVFAQQRRSAVVKMAAQPWDPFRFRYRLEATPHCVVAHDTRQAEEFGQHAVGPQGRHVRVALVAGQHRQHCRAEHVALVRRIRARVVQRAVGNQGVEHPGRLEKLDEERRLADRREGCVRIPLHMHPTGPAIERHPLGSGLPINRRLPTPAVSGDIALCTAHAIHNAPNSSPRNHSNCRIWDNYSGAPRTARFGGPAIAVLVLRGGGLGTTVYWASAPRIASRLIQTFGFGMLKPGPHSLVWSWRGKPTDSISIAAQQNGLRLLYWVTDSNGERSNINEFVPFAYTPTRFGGRRQRLMCGVAPW